MSTKKLLTRTLFILGMIALFAFPVVAGEPPSFEIDVLDNLDDPSVITLDLEVCLDILTKQITVETNPNQWNTVTIYNIDTGLLFSVEIICSTENDDCQYCTQAPSFPGNYCILFQNDSTKAYGFFQII